MVKLSILAGGSVAFITSYLFDSVDRTLTLVQQNPSGQNASWIQRSVVNPSILYAINGVKDGALQSFTIFENGTLSGAISSASTNGSGPVHILSSPSGEVSTMNYGTGNGAIINTQNNGSIFGNSTFITFPIVGSSNVSHPHETIQLEDELLVPDLGGDTIWRLVSDQNGVFSIRGEITQPAGSGPRHAVIRDSILVTLHETSCTVTSQRIPPLGQNSSDIISNLSIVPEDQVSLQGAVFAAGEILIPPPNAAFPSTLVYASNRNTGTTVDPRGDAIAIFTLDTDGKLQLVNQFFTGLNQVQGMQFGGPDNRFLVTSGAVGNTGVIVFERVGQGAEFVQVANNTDPLNPVSFVWV